MKNYRYKLRGTIYRLRELVRNVLFSVFLSISFATLIMRVFTGSFNIPIFMIGALGVGIVLFEKNINKNEVPLSLLLESLKNNPCIEEPHKFIERWGGSYDDNYEKYISRGMNPKMALRWLKIEDKIWDNELSPKPFLTGQSNADLDPIDFYKNDITPEEFYYFCTLGVFTLQEIMDIKNNNIDMEIVKALHY